MDRQEHIHIISAGDNIHKVYPAILDELKTVTHTFIFAEKDVYTDSSRDDRQKRMWKSAIRHAIDKVNTLSRTRNISCALVLIDAATFDAIRDPVLGIFSEHPSARYSFDISAGSKRLSLGLFSLSLWVEGDVYYAFGNSPIRRVPVPTLATKTLPASPHHLVILTILFRGQEHEKETHHLVPGETLFNETKGWKIPVRNAGEDEGSPARELSHAAFSRLIANLIGWNLVREETNPENERETLYRITPDGELALIVYSARMKKRSVAAPDGLT